MCLRVPSRWEGVRVSWSQPGWSAGPRPRRGGERPAACPGVAACQLPSHPSIISLFNTSWWRPAPLTGVLVFSASSQLLSAGAALFTVHINDASPPRGPEGACRKWPGAWRAHKHALTSRAALALAEPQGQVLPLVHRQVPESPHFPRTQGLPFPHHRSA